MCPPCLLLCCTVEAPLPLPSLVPGPSQGPTAPGLPPSLPVHVPAPPGVPPPLPPAALPAPPPLSPPGTSAAPPSTSSTHSTDTCGSKGQPFSPLCTAPRCVLEGHQALRHALFSAVAMWGRNQCVHCIGDDERQAEGYGFVMVCVLIGLAALFRC